MNYFILFFMIHEATRYTRYQSYRQHKGNTMETKTKQERLTRCNNRDDLLHLCFTLKISIFSERS